MCRWLAYSGVPLYLDELIFKPEHSLHDQSLAAHFTGTKTNGDGFGVAWYGSRETPGVYRGTQPAWNDVNLRDLAAQIQSSLFLAHVRAATVGAIQQTNCQPFRYGKWLFVHNGLIRGFDRIKRDLAFAISSDLYPLIGGSTDSEIMFYLALTFGMEDDPVGGIERMVGFIEDVSRQHGIANPVHMTLGVGDGSRIFAVRYSTERQSRTLFFSKRLGGLHQLRPDLRRISEDAVVVASEPLTGVSGYWTEIPESTAVLVENRGVVIEKFEPHLPLQASAYPVVEFRRARDRLEEAVA